MQKILLEDSEKCTGCRMCEMVCSVKHEGVSNPTRSRIHVIKWETEGLALPMICQQCESPPCMAVCPKDAISRDEELGRMMVDYDLCIGCKMCVVACPFGGMGIDAVARKVVKCDLCDGDPICVRFCQPEALQYVPLSTVNLRKKRGAGLKFAELMSRFA
jgi:Fe-S-cluster-containing hydrogenase component 2